MSRSNKNRGRVIVARHAGVHQDQNAKHPSKTERQHTRSELRVAAFNNDGFTIAWDRDEHEQCQRGTFGCCVDHEQSVDPGCQTW